MSSSLSQQIKLRWTNTRCNTIDVSGLTAASASYVIATLLAEHGDKLLVVAPTSDESVRLHSDINSFLSAFQTQADESVDLFPGWERLPHEGTLPSTQIRSTRVRTLSRALLGASSAVITDIFALAQKTLAPSEFCERFLHLTVGDIRPPHELELLFTQHGYVCADPVEDAGFFSRRGFILDVYPSNTLQPVRLEFFGDEIESIRFFDSVTQRATKDLLNTVCIAPAREWLVNEHSRVATESLIKQHCDSVGIPKKLRDPLTERIRAAISDPSDDYLWPFFETRSALLSDYLPGWKIVIYNALSCTEQSDELRASLKSAEAIIQQRNLILPPMKLLFASTEELDRIMGSTVLSLGDISLGSEVQSLNNNSDEHEAPTCSFRVACNDNSDLKTVALNDPHASLELFLKLNQSWSGQHYLRCIFAGSTTQAERVSYLLSQRGLRTSVAETVGTDSEVIYCVSRKLSAGFRISYDRIAIITDSEFFGSKKRTATLTTTATSAKDDLSSLISSLDDLIADDLIVHTTHGVGRYKLLVKLVVDQIEQDFLLLEYLGGDKLYLPIYRLENIQKYIGSREGNLIDKLGSQHFEKAKARVRESLRELAHELLKLYAERASQVGFKFSPPDEMYKEFEARFPYVETPDQLSSINATLKDMQEGKIMDRLICGDVGYGKTEVAIRAAFKAVLDGKQVAVLVPTTILCFQHERSFRERLKDYPVKIAAVSRFKGDKEIMESLEGVRDGSIDIIIGTHRLLSRDVAFKDLGLLIIDEEHRFGVEHKEKLKMLKSTAGCLTLTATPIPRTLQLSLLGLREISLINTPPADRLSVRTFVAKTDDRLIREAILQEMKRGGQTFFIYNKVQTIEAMKDRLSKMVPEARICVAHGQMKEGALEKCMLEFYARKHDVLLCSTIVESGIDIPTANTMIIDRADQFGLAQLYQLRGRVGRSQARAYCYLLLPDEGRVTGLAKKRLDIMQRFADLGAGFKVASHDLELRGGGDILGKSQSGHIAAIGLELYSELLDEAVLELRGQKHDQRFDPEIKIPEPALLPETYIPDVQQRLHYYKNLSQAKDDYNLREIEAEIEDRYGRAPTEAQNLYWLIRIKQLLILHRTKAVIAGRQRISLEGGGEAKISPQKVMEALKRSPRLYSMTPDSRIVIHKNYASVRQLYEDIHAFLSQVADATG